MRASLQVGAVALALAFGAGCRQDMHDQPKFIPLRPSEFFADGRSARPLVEGTVAVSYTHLTLPTNREV